MQEKILWARVLERAVNDAIGKQIESASPHNIARYKQDALNWIKSDRKELFSFLWVCHVLEQDPYWIRTRIKNLFHTANYMHINPSIGEIHGTNAITPR